MAALLKYTGGLINKGMYDNQDNRIVPGFYTSNTVDLHGHIVDKNAMLAALTDYRENWNTVRLMHDEPIGLAKSIGQPYWNFMEALVAKTARGDEVLQLVDQGIYKAFSVGILVTNGEFVPFDKLAAEDLDGLPLNMLELFREIGDVFKITDLTLVEVSIVDRPANPMARVQHVQNELGSQVGGVLPSLGVRSGIDTIKSMVRSSGIYVPVTAEIKDVLGNTEVITVETELEKQVDAEPEVEAPVETPAPVEPVTEPEQEQDVDVVAEVSKVLGDFANELKSMFEDLTTYVKAIDIDAAISKALAAQVVEPVTTEEKETTVAFSDEQVKSLVSQVVAGLEEVRMQRKSVVSANADGDSEAQTVDLKKLSQNELSAFIAKAAIGASK